MAPIFIGNKMTNEQILITFLKKHRRFAETKRNFLNGISECHIEDVVNGAVSVKWAIHYLFLWDMSEKGHSYWANLSVEWMNLCRHFGLNGSINLKNAIK